MKDKESMGGQVYLLKLDKDHNYESEIYRVSTGSSVELSPGPSLYGYSIEIFTNAPASPDQAFERAKYRRLQSKLDSTIPSFDKLYFDTPGSYHFYFTLDEVKSGEGYILVDPRLQVGGDDLSLDSVQCLTVISKYLGTFSTWKQKLLVAKTCNYNVLHFTPIQRLGDSNSAYSLRDQLSLNPVFSKPGQPLELSAVKQFLDFLRKDWKMLSVSDIVLNHTANETDWLWTHPECSYNLINSPHLRPAYLLDVVLAKFSREISAGSYSHRGLPPEIDSEDHLNALRHILWADILSEAKIPQMMMVDVEQTVSEFLAQCRLAEPSPEFQVTESSDKLVIIQDPYYRKLRSTIDLSLALHCFNIYRKDCFDEDSRVKKCTEMFKEKLMELNSAMESKINAHLDAAVNNVVASVRYFRVQPDGPRIPAVTEKEPIVPRYFVEKLDELDEALAWSDGEEASLVMAHNGWVMNDDPLRNFASPDSNVYLRRELIAWGDSVKLRFGEGPEDCPYLWKKMRDYVEMTAELFDGVRLDNCHSTPLHVAQYMLDACRKVRPNLYVVAELFTNSVSTDNLFVNKLGITSLIRESMSAWDSHELGRLVYRYGGRPVGSLLGAADDSRLCTKLSPGVAHALFLDQTHDNPSPVEKRSPYDLLPSTALVAMACTAVGSNLGYDHLVPHHIDVVKETREYMDCEDEKKLNCRGIVQAKAFLNSLHSYLTTNSFNQVFVDQLNSDIVCVTRHNPSTLDSILTVAFTAFSQPDQATSAPTHLSITLTSVSTCSILAQAYLTHTSGSRLLPISDFKKSDKVINGLSEYELELKGSLIPGDEKGLDGGSKDSFASLHWEDGGTKLRITFNQNFLPGSILTLRVSSSEEAQRSATLLNKESDFEKALESALMGCDLIDVNHILFKSSPEEPGGNYNLPGAGPLVYAGIQGIMSVVTEICEKDDQGHPLCCNIREGPWLAEYTTARLLRYPPTAPLGKILSERLKLVNCLPPGMKPFYFMKIISKAYFAVRNHALSLMSLFARESGDLARELCISSLEFVGCVDSATLPALASSLQPPPHRYPLPTIAAGLPHFSVDYMRSWGRDTFIALRGLLLLTGRFPEARWLILGYGACVRHGLVPNLLASGITPRYNCRDAVWWWLQSIKEYVALCPSGLSILRDPVLWLFPHDSPTNDSPTETPLHDVIKRCLEAHFQGVCFREHNAGIQIDQHMKSEGFDNQIGVHPDTGFVFGGNEWNCGTWMDKMGSSCEAGTKGHPATPRDGSAVELVGLSYSVISWLSRLAASRDFPYPTVTRTSSMGVETTWSLADWAERIRQSFESEFWIGNSCSDPHVNKRNIYKDTIGAKKPWEDFRLRPNFLIPLVLAPELFDVDHARAALKVVESLLVGPLGVKTLDSDDLWYSPDYDNNNQSHDAIVAHGFNYHQGPEWVWPMGYFLRAKLLFEGDVAGVKRILSNMWAHLTTSPWKGLPELTNSKGKPCKDSCPTQAWSIATTLEALYDLDKFETAVKA